MSREETWVTIKGPGQRLSVRIDDDEEMFDAMVSHVRHKMRHKWVGEVERKWNGRAPVWPLRERLEGE